MQGKTVAESKTIMTQAVFLNDVNNNGTLYGGRLLYWIDMLGGIVAKKHSRSAIVTASIDSLSFLSPIRQSDIVTLESWVNFVGRTSMEIEVRVSSENSFTANVSKNCRAFLTYVATDDKGKPKPVPSLILTSAEEENRYEQAKQRRAERLRSRDLEATEW